MTAVGGWKLLAILALAGFVTSFGAHVVAVNLPSYAQITGIGAFMIGVLIAVYDAAELIAKPVAGYVADRRGLKVMLLAGLATFVAGSLLFLVIDPRGLLVVRQAGAGQGLTTFAIDIDLYLFTRPYTATHPEAAHLASVTQPSLDVSIV